MFLTSPNLEGIPHGFFTRRGGMSQGLYASLNCGTGSDDKAEHVIENRERVLKRLGGGRLLSVHQVHGSDVVTVTAPWRHAKKPKADAMVTVMPGVALGILTADCVPVLFADKNRKVIGAAHAGWKGLLAGVLARTVEAMTALGAERGGIAAAVGPCIGRASYEVGAELREAFVTYNPAYAAYFSEGARAGHFLFDIRACARARLEEAGLSQINALENDTYIEEDAFFSFRRTTHRNEPDYGRQVSAIMLTP